MMHRCSPPVPALSVVARAARRPGDVALLTTGVMAALGLRVAIGGDTVASSFPAAGTFAATLIAVGLLAGWRPSRPRASALLVGLLGAVLLVAFPLALGPPVRAGTHGSPGLLLGWGTLVSIVAWSEELVLRGVLFSAVARRAGDLAAVGVAAGVFALLHVPLYGWPALSLDLAVGIWLGGLRLLTGGMAAPATAHIAADLTTWWL